jgi:putative membrane protein
MTTIAPARDAFWTKISIIVGVVVCAAVAFLILGPRPEGMAGSLDVSGLPVVNASLNATTTVLLLVALGFIKARRITAHKNTMLTAFGTSTLFLVTYIIYHWFKAGPKAYVGDFREVYLVILLSHIVLAMGIVPLVLVTLYRGWSDQREKHKKLARITLPLWLYVSVTGVVIYWMLY